MISGDRGTGAERKRKRNGPEKRKRGVGFGFWGLLGQRVFFFVFGFVKTFFFGMETGVFPLVLWVPTGRTPGSKGFLGSPGSLKSASGKSTTVRGMV